MKCSTTDFNGDDLIIMSVVSVHDKSVLTNKKMIQISHLY